MKKDEIKKKVSGALDLPKEAVMNLPLLTLMGKDELSIENYKGIIEYSEDRIRINTACGVLRISGKGLFLKQITAENILVTGVIEQMEYIA